MAACPPEHHVDRVGHRMGNCSGCPFLAEMFGVTGKSALAGPFSGGSSMATILKDGYRQQRRQAGPEARVLQLRLGGVRTG